MTDSGAGKFGESSVIELTGKIMVVTIILLFFVIVFVICLHLYAKWFWYRRQVNPTTTTRRRRRRLDFSAGYNETTAAVAALRRGLDPSVLKTIPITLFDPKEFKDGLECAVCLCEVSEGEKTRLLPKCNHGFHVECIDMWFQSHSTCPLCRNPAANQGSQSSENSAADSTLETAQQIPAVENPGFSTETPNFPTNVLFWGDETQVSTFGPNCVEKDHQSCAINEPSSSSSSSSSSLSRSNLPDGILVIDIPIQINEEEEQKSPMPTRFRSLKRLLSGNRRTNPSSPKNFDLEQGVRGQS